MWLNLISMWNWFVAPNFFSGFASFLYFWKLNSYINVNWIYVRYFHSEDCCTCFSTHVMLSNSYEMSIWISWPTGNEALSKNSHKFKHILFNVVHGDYGISQTHSYRVLHCVFRVLKHMQKLYNYKKFKRKWATMFHSFFEPCVILCLESTLWMQNQTQNHKETACFFFRIHEIETRKTAITTMTATSEHLQMVCVRNLSPGWGSNSKYMYTHSLNWVIVEDREKEGGSWCYTALYKTSGLQFIFN